MTLPDALASLLRSPALCYVTTVMADGSPQLTQTWVDTDGEHVVINIVRGMQKARNLERDPRVAVAVSAGCAEQLLPNTRPGDRGNKRRRGSLDRGAVPEVHRRPVRLVRGPRPGPAESQDRGRTHQ
jgi:predicted pyridoxine 5'-phosphate oxidase superfamily flavin-nucleotide-binding protein